MQKEFKGWCSQEVKGVSGAGRESVQSFCPGALGCSLVCLIAKRLCREGAGAVVALSLSAASLWHPCCEARKRVLVCAGHPVGCEGCLMAPDEWDFIAVNSGMSLLIRFILLNQYLHVSGFKAHSARI